MRAHAVYQSRLELSRLLYDDFEYDDFVPTVTAVFAQPFLVSAVADGKTRRHVPDFLAVRERRSRAR